MAISRSDLETATMHKVRSVESDAHCISNQRPTWDKGAIHDRTNRLRETKYPHKAGGYCDCDEQSETYKDRFHASEASPVNSGNVLNLSSSGF